MGRALSVHQEHELLRKLEDAGLTAEIAQAVIQSRGNELARLLIEQARRRVPHRRDDRTARKDSTCGEKVSRLSFWMLDRSDYREGQQDGRHELLVVVDEVVVVAYTYCFAYGEQRSIPPTAEGTSLYDLKREHALMAIECEESGGSALRDIGLYELGESELLQTLVVEFGGPLQPQAHSLLTQLRAYRDEWANGNVAVAGKLEDLFSS